MKKYISFFCDIFLKTPFLTLGIISVILYFSVMQISKLSINSNQIDLLPPEYPEVINTKKVIEMIGGNGFFILTLKPKDEKGMEEHLHKAYSARTAGDLDTYKKEIEISDKIRQDNIDYYKKNERLLKETADEINQKLIHEKDILYISYRYDVSFLQDRFPLYIQPVDLREIKDRIQKKIEFEKEKSNPFYMNLSGEEYNPDFNDIILKYTKLSKRDIFDEYTISPDKGMLIMLIKPTGSFIDMDFTRSFEIKITQALSEMNLEQRGVRYGYTGTYKLNLDDYDSLVNALKPVSIASLIGIVILLLLFFRKPIFIIILTISLVSGVLITFGITGFFIGRLNTITSVLSAVLMGLGIDYGIQFLYRFREEFTNRNDFLLSVKETVYHTGEASLISACTTSSAFIVLMFSEFRGFSEFGLIACYGILTIAFCMYFLTALQISLFLKFFPSQKSVFFFNDAHEKELGFVHRVFDHPKRVLIISGSIILFLSLLSPLATFNYSGRDLLLENQESLLLYDEIADRFEVSSDPQVIVVDTMEETEAIADFFNPVSEEMSVSVDQLVSAWNLVPPIDQQKVNLHIIKEISDLVTPLLPLKESKKKKQENSDLNIIKPEYQKHIPTVRKYLNVKEFVLSDVPDIFKSSFKEVVTSKEKGHLVFVYPKVALWHGKDLLNFYYKVGDFEYPYISYRTINTLLHSENIDYASSTRDYRAGEFNDSEVDIILSKANILTEAELLRLGILPLTAKFIVDHRPYHSIEDLRKFKKRANTVGSVILFAKLAQIVQSEGVIAIFATLIIVTVILILFYRSFQAAFISLIPLILGIFVMLGIMGITNIKINFMNVLVFPIIIGYAIQNGIYIYYRFLEEVDVAHALVKVGPAVIASTLTTLVGWSVLLLAEHRGLHSIGLAASIGISTTLVIALTLLPSILEKYLKKTTLIPSTLNGIPEEPSVSISEPNEIQESRFVEEFLEFQEANSLESPEKKPKASRVTRTPKEPKVKDIKEKKEVIAKKTISKKKKSAKKNS
jgi:predicted RND superfamily exporter protein